MIKHKHREGQYNEFGQRIQPRIRPMTTDKKQEAPKPKPGLLVEDRKSAVRTAPNGEQTIVKVPDRKQEAERQGVSESQI